MTQLRQIRFTGIVQGVGFRPTVWRLAQECGLTGEVCNDAEGVLVKAWGNEQAIETFIRRMHEEPPPLARIDSVSSRRIEDEGDPPSEFRIQTSRQGAVHTDVAADAATCPECLAEILDPNDRRYRYPFTNCTHCGPRLSIIRSVPYDRASTSMSVFKMCSSCQAEYEDPADRRFHAQPNACADCGPQVWLEDRLGERLPPDADCDLIETTARMIRAGHIVAVKGIGGIHLACDAANADAVQQLRQRKRRYNKAFALMATDLDMVRRFVSVDPAEAELLVDRAAPILVLQARGEALAPGVAPGQNTLGFMLPYTPLHHLLMQNMNGPIVLTSGNRSDEPQTIGNQDAHERLDGIADYYLLHDREIVNRLDDSVLRIADGSPRFLRRARGFAPMPIPLPEQCAEAGSILAMGGELKNTFCLAKDGKAILSQHMGDLEDALTLRDYHHNLQLYRQLFDFTPDAIVVDQHPDYLSTQTGRELAADLDLPLIEVQHHHAHITACMAEHGLPLDSGPLLGVALDGLGYGGDGSLWGGEFLQVDYQDYERLAWFQPIPMLGGAKAMYEPWRNTLAHLEQCIGWETLVADYADLEIVRFLREQPLKTLLTMARRGLNSPPASSAGRLFDALAAAVGVSRESASFEGQAAIQLEALAGDWMQQEAGDFYPCERAGQLLSWAPLWRLVLKDLQDGLEPGRIAARFHLGLAHAVAETAGSLCAARQIGLVVLSGGVFQNRLLLKGTSRLLREKGLKVLAPVQTPANDGGISLGQAAIAAACLNNR